MLNVPTKQKHSIIIALVSGFVGLAYEGITSFLHNRRHKALHKAVKAMDSKTTIECNTVMHLENSVVMYGIYNTETLEKLINTVHSIHNFTSPYENLFVDSKKQHCFNLYTLYMQGIQHYSINSLLYLQIVKEKYVLMYKELQLCIHTGAIRNLQKDIFPFHLLPHQN